MWSVFVILSYLCRNHQIRKTDACTCIFWYQRSLDTRSITISFEVFSLICIVRQSLTEKTKEGKHIHKEHGQRRCDCCQRAIWQSPEIAWCFKNLQHVLFLFANALVPSHQKGDTNTTHANSIPLHKKRPGKASHTLRSLQWNPASIEEIPHLFPRSLLISIHQDPTKHPPPTRVKSKFRSRTFSFSET